MNKLYHVKSALQENIFSWTSPGPVAFENGQAMIICQTSPKKIS